MNNRQRSIFSLFINYSIVLFGALSSTYDGYNNKQMNLSSLDSNDQGLDQSASDPTHDRSINFDSYLTHLFYIVMSSFDTLN
jgi:hypothetical protein